MLITEQEVSKIMGAPLSNVKLYYPLLIEELRKRNKLKISFLVAILATVGVESGQFAPVREGYWLKPQVAQRYFNKQYSHRKDLGNRGWMEFDPDPDVRAKFKPEYRNDGYKYRGAGFVQLTGLHNWNKYGLTEENLNDPQKAIEVLVSFMINSGCDVWAQRAYDQTDQWDELSSWRKVRRQVNGGYNGIEKFLPLVEAFKEAAKS